MQCSGGGGGGRGREDVEGKCKEFKEGKAVGIGGEELECRYDEHG